MVNEEDMWMIPEFPISWNDLNKLRDACYKVDKLFKSKRNAEAKDYFNEKVVLVNKHKTLPLWKKLEIESLLLLHLPVLDRVYVRYFSYLDREMLSLDTALGKATVQIFYDLGY